MGVFNREKVKALAGTQGDMHQGSHYIIEIAGHVVGGIEKIEGLKDTHDVIQSRDTDDHVGHMRGRAGNKKHHTFKLYRQWGQRRCTNGVSRQRKRSSAPPTQAS